jgi:hypothetical protein
MSSFRNETFFPSIITFEDGSTLTSAYNLGVPNSNVVNAASGFGITANTQVALQGTWSNASKTISIGVNDPPFKLADVGKIIFGTTNLIQANGYINGTTAFSGTITSFNSATSVGISAATVLASAAPATSGLTGYVVWGTDDTIGLQAAWTATLAAVGRTLILPSGMMMVTSAPFINLVGSWYNAGIQGAGANASSSVIVVPPSYNWAAATNAIVYYDNGINKTRLWTGNADNYDQNPFAMTALRNFTVWGGGADGTTLTNPLPIINANNAYLDNVAVVGLNWKWNNSTSNNGPGIQIAGCVLQNCNAWSAGNCGLNVLASGPITQLQNLVIGGFYGVCLGAGMVMTAGSTFGNHLISQGVQWSATNTTPTSTYGVNQTGGTWESFGDQASGITVTGGNCHLNGLRDGFIGDFGLFLSGAGAISMKDCQLQKVTMSAGTLYDLGGNLNQTTLTPWTTISTNNITGGLIVGTASITGISLVATNITPSTGWGTTGVAGNGVSAVSGYTKRIQFTITAAGSPAPSPTIAIVFPTPFAAVPIVTLKQIGGTNFTDVTNPIQSVTATKTGVTFSLTGTPTAADTYTFLLEADI